jgi:hypothetical protein
MKSSNMFAILSIITLGFSTSLSAFATVREGGGLGNFHILYQCTEVAPTNPADPVVASIDLVASTVMLTVHARSKSTPNNVYQNKVELNQDVRCMVACEVYENKNDDVRFSLTNIGKFSRGNFHSPRGSLSFTCERGAYLN